MPTREEVALAHVTGFSSGSARRNGPNLLGVGVKLAQPR